MVDCDAFFGSDPKRGFNISAEELATDLSSRGVGRAVALSLQGVYYEYAEGNRETLDSSRQLPFLIPAATIDPRRFYGKGDEDLGLSDFKVLRLFPDIQAWPIDYAPVERILQEAASVNIPVMVSASGQGRGTQIARAASASGVPLILTSVTYSTLSEALVLLDRHDDLFLCTDMLNTPDGIELISEERGAERMVFGSGFPLTYLAGPLMAVQKSQIPESEKRKILSGNILHLLGLR